MIIGRAATLSDTRLRDWMVLMKPRITLMVVLTALVGYYLAAKGLSPLPTLAATLLGTALTTAGAGILNMIMEQDSDALMRRTRNRPLVTGRIRVREALWVGMLLSVGGTLYLAVAVNLVTSALALLALVVYVQLYTPLKRTTPWCTAVGAVSGAIPPVMGWTAVKESVGVEALVLFLILFLWQMPHFLAIAVLYREDYERGRLPMLPVVDANGNRSAFQMVAYSVALLAVSLLPQVLGMAGTGYSIGAMVLSGLFLALNLRYARQRSLSLARAVFLASLLYLPGVLIAMVVSMP